MSAPMRARWALHPLTPAVVLLLLGGLGAVSALVSERGLASAGALLLLALVAGAAAGFANSGST